MRVSYLVVILSVLVGLSGAHAALVGEWNFEDAANPANDSSGNGYNGTLTGIRAYRTTDTAARGQASMFLNSALASGYLSLPDMTAQFGTSQATLAMWVKLTNAVPGLSTVTGLATFGNASISPYPATHYPWTGPVAGYFNVFRGTSRVDGVTLASDVDRAQWHLLAITTTPGGSGYRIYQNAELVYTGASDFFLPASPRVGMSLDTTNTNSYYLDGWIDDVRLYNTALSQSEIQALIPEPATLGMLALALLGLLRRRAI